MNKKTIFVIGGIVLVVGLVAFAMISGQKPYVPGGGSPTSGSEVLEQKPAGTITEQGNGINSLKDSGENVELFRKINGRLDTPFTLKYPGSTDNPGNTFVSMGRAFKLSFSKNWLTNIDSNTINSVHTTGPSFTLKQTAMPEKYDIELVNTQLSELVISTGNTTGKVNDIFYADRVTGRLATCKIMIDGEEFILDAAIFLCEREVYQFVCIYPPETEETVSSLYNSITYNDRSVTIK